MSFVFTGRSKGHCRGRSTKVVGSSRSSLSSDTTSTISSAEITNIIERLKTEHLRNSTRNTYHRIWKLFGKFYLRLDIKPSNWEDRIVLFVGFLINNKLQSAMIKTYVSALCAVLAEDNIRVNEDHFLLSSLIRACKLKNDQVIARFPIYKGLLHLILKEVEQFYRNQQQLYLETLYKVMFASSYFGLLQAGAVAKGPHVILAYNVHVATNKNKILFILNTSKMHSHGNKPQLIKINSHPVQANQKNHTNEEVKHFCPFILLKNYITIRPIAQSINEQFFVFADNSAVTPDHYWKVLHLMLKNLQFNPNLYNLHSFRIGRCRDLFHLGVTVKTIKKIGRWKSNAVFTYFRD